MCRVGPLRRPEARLGEGGEPEGRLALRREQVCQTIACKVHQPHVRGAPGQVGLPGEGHKRRPAPALLALEEAGHRLCELHKVELPVARQVEQKLPAARQGRRGRCLTNGAGGGEGAAAVGSVEPGARLFAEQAGQTLAVKVDPEGARVAEADCSAVGGQGVDGRVDRRLGVAQLDRRHGLARVAGRRVAEIAHLGNRREERQHRPLGVAEVERAHQHRVGPELCGEAVEHQGAPAESVAPHLEPCPIARKGIGPHRPGAGRGGLRRRPVVLAVVEHQLKQPVVAQGQVLVGAARRGVAVAHTLEMPGGEGARGEPRPLLGQRLVDAGAILSLVAVKGRVAPVVVARADHPAEDAQGVGGVGDAGLGPVAVERGDIVAAHRAPVAQARLLLRPVLDAGEQALYSGEIAGHLVGTPPNSAYEAVAPPCGAVAHKGGHQVLAAGQDKDVRRGAVVVLGQAPVGASGDGGQAEAPPGAKGAVAQAGVVAERELGREARSTGAQAEG